MQHHTRFTFISVVMTIVNVFIVYTTLFTNLYNQTIFNFWYWPGALIIFLTLIFNTLCLLLGMRLILNIILFICNIILLIIFTSPFLLS
ncbi:hypothetical protein E2558_11135 [Staphylococcus pragensis]|uniref:Uncharacterized protein n=1 Tax=Staphylococcus pragensis TaxID=1611836 RepID=A0A4Z1BDC6_9STAP|nr:hypothetical protein CD154_00690 [Staphylococcus carnosus]TGN23160.1 hypothetical protein E2558_11135 [Staphylococcus pragensis]